MKPKLSIFYYYCKELGHWRRHCYKPKCFRHFLSPLIASPMSFQSMTGLQELWGFFPIFSFYWLEETLLQIGDESLPVLTDTGTTLLVLNSTAIK